MTFLLFNNLNIETLQVPIELLTSLQECLLTIEESTIASAGRTKSIISSPHIHMEISSLLISTCQRVSFRLVCIRLDRFHLENIMILISKISKRKVSHHVLNRICYRLTHLQREGCLYRANWWNQFDLGLVSRCKRPDYSLLVDFPHRRLNLASFFGGQMDRLFPIPCSQAFRLPSCHHKSRFYCPPGDSKTSETLFTT